jgi:hypothetical protein
MTLYLSVRAQRFIPLKEEELTRKRKDARLARDHVIAKLPRAKRNSSLAQKLVAPSRTYFFFAFSRLRVKHSLVKASTALAVALIATTQPSKVAADEFDRAERIDDAHLADMRGGFILQDGVTIGLGAIVRTTVDGQLALETQLVWQQQGALITQQVGATLTPTQGALTNTVTLPNGTQAFVLGEGETAIIHRVTDGSIQNILLNTASGRTIRQDTEVTLTLTGFQPVQLQIIQEQWGRALANDLGLATQGAIAR